MKKAIFLTIKHEGFRQPIRVTNYPEKYKLHWEVYEPMQFRIIQPTSVQPWPIINLGEVPEEVDRILRDALGETPKVTVTFEIVYLKRGDVKSRQKDVPTWLFWAVAVTKWPDGTTKSALFSPHIPLGDRTP